jgi:hypothetical protein
MTTDVIITISIREKFPTDCIRQEFVTTNKEPSRPRDCVSGMSLSLGLIARERRVTVNIKLEKGLPLFSNLTLLKVTAPPPNIRKILSVKL